MERVLSIGERLQRLLDEAEKEAEAKLAEAQKRADEMISRARAAADRRRALAQRGRGVDELLKAEEEKAEKEAAAILRDYKRKAEALKAVPEERMREAVNRVLEEVLPR